MNNRLVKISIIIGSIIVVVLVATLILMSLKIISFKPKPKPIQDITFQDLKLKQTELTTADLTNSLASGKPATLTQTDKNTIPNLQKDVTESKWQELVDFTDTGNGSHYFLYFKDMNSFALEVYAQWDGFAPSWNNSTVRLVKKEDICPWWQTNQTNAQNFGAKIDDNVAKAITCP